MVVYAFQLASGDYELVATYVGYQRFTQPLTIANGNVTVDIQLEADVVGLDQVVVVGYGEVSRRNVTGAITSVRGDDIQFAPVNTVENAIQGPYVRCVPFSRTMVNWGRVYRCGFVDLPRCLPVTSRST